MNSFSTGPQASQQPREMQRNYVFVDEHNRHKRLKVMRACEGCRRRKIKCDAATTNTWPCAACVRLKLQCVRPNGFDGSSADMQAYESPARAEDEGGTLHQPQPDFRQHDSLPPGRQAQQGGQHPVQTKPGAALYVHPPASYTNPSEAVIYRQQPFPEAQTSSQALEYSALPPQVGAPGSGYMGPDIFPSPPAPQVSHSASPSDSYAHEQHGQDLADLLGPLKLDESGTAPYLNSKIRPADLGEELPAVGDDDEYKSQLPPLVSGPGLKIRIPPELMPDDNTVLNYLDLYFVNVHPFVPVLDKASVYDQWHRNREALSPLVLEAIFAIAGRLADEPAQGQQWLALATRHADSFMDVPRISTLQALLIVLKAREAAPKRGYYYRSWMSIVHCVQMGKDLGLDDHYSDHQAGRSCGSSPAECLMKTRIWQTIFVCEVMIGSPQGRHDLAVSEDTVDLRVPRPVAGVDEPEYYVTRNFTYLARVVANVSRMSRTYARVRKKNRDWGLDPEFVQLTPASHSWPNELPSDLAVTYPPSGSPPWLTSPFIGNMHSYYHLSVIMLHRPQLQFLDPNGPDGQWKQHMAICYSSAKLLCRLEEAIMQIYGLGALQAMQRGVNFTIYAILTCIVLHLVAITSPDPDLNSDAREYFTRHMRLLEKCMTYWPVPDMQKQIDAVREAFSADIRKPFALKPSFPYGSPQSTSGSSPSRSATSDGQMSSMEGPQLGESHQMKAAGDMQAHHHQRRQQQPQLQHLRQQTTQVSPVSYPMTPPFSVGTGDILADHSSDPRSTMVSVAAAPGSQAPSMRLQAIPLAATPAWNPSRLFDQWNSTFGTTPQTPDSSVSGPTVGGAPEVSTLQDLQAMQTSVPPGMHHAPGPAFPRGPPQPFITPAMWQESVASIYKGGLKRGWDYN